MLQAVKYNAVYTRNLVLLDVILLRLVATIILLNFVITIDINILTLEN